MRTLPSIPTSIVMLAVFSGWRPYFSAFSKRFQMARWNPSGSKDNVSGSAPSTNVS